MAGWPPKAAPAPHVVPEHAVDCVTILRGTFWIDADRLGGVSLPGQIAVGEAGIGGAITQPAFEHFGRTLQVGCVAQVDGSGDARSAGMRAPVVGPLLVGRDQRAAVQCLVTDTAQPGPELSILGCIIRFEVDQVGGDDVGDQIA
jgi:hypothetical protein